MKTVLLIDDDVDLRSALSSVLQKHGWEVIETDDGGRAVELARQHRPRAILCDLLMPGTNGFRVCAAIRDDDALRYSLLVAMSGKRFEDTRQAALEAGADEFFTKPIDCEQLLSSLNRVAGPASPANPPDKRAGAESTPFLRFWGVRGSVPVPGPDTARYGGNTACVEFRSEDGIIILDAGTGLRPLGEALGREFEGQPLDLAVLITHFHWDHIQGFPFFRPANDPANHIRILGFESTREGLAGIFSAQMTTPYFPVSLGRLAGRLSFEQLRSMEFEIGKVKVQAAFANHPGVCVGYRLNIQGVSVAYLPDHEPFDGIHTHKTVPEALHAQAMEFARSEDEKLVHLLHRVDALILDAQFDAEEYARYPGWGHSSVDDAVDLAVRAEARRLFLFHHDPAHSDEKIDQLVQHGRRRAAKLGGSLDIEAAREGLKCELVGKPRR